MGVTQKPEIFTNMLRRNRSKGRSLALQTLFEIDLTKQGLAKQIAIDLDKNFESMTISECEKKINYLSDLSPSAEDDVRSMKAELFFRKATLLHESNFFIDALRYYEIALSNDRGLSKLIDKRIDSLIQGILEKSTGYQNENELLLAVESLKVVSSLDKELSFKLSFSKYVSDRIYREGRVIQGDSGY